MGLTLTRCDRRRPPGRDAAASGDSARAVSRRKTLILDEPTALLTPQEVDELYDVLNRLRQSGDTIIFITHKLREVAAISDRVTVIHRGRTVGTRETGETTASQLAR